MTMAILAGVVLIGFGIASLIFPDLTRGLDRFSNQLSGVKTEQGGAYEFSRIFRGVMIIIAGILLLMLPTFL